MGIAGPGSMAVKDTQASNTSSISNYKIENISCNS